MDDKPLSDHNWSCAANEGCEAGIEPRFTTRAPHQNWVSGNRRRDL